jgi:hypothetical protein
MTEMESNYFIETGVRAWDGRLSASSVYRLRSTTKKTKPEVALGYQPSPQQFAAAWQCSSGNCRNGRALGDRRVSMPSLRIL